MNKYSRVVTMHVFRVSCLLTILIITGLLSMDATAQFQRNGSVYSRFGVGQLKTFHSSQVAAMGGGGYALSSGRYKTFGNPASWSNQVLTGVAGGFSYEGLLVDDGTNDVARLGSGTLTSIQFGFPLIAQRLGVGLSFSPYSETGYRIRVEDSIGQGLAPGDTSDYTIDFLGSGGLQALTAGVGYAVNPRISVGLSGDFIFGLIEESRETVFEDTDFASTKLTESLRLSGFRATIGVSGNLPNVFGDNDRLSAGLVVTTPTSLSGRKVNVFGSTQEPDTLGVGRDADATLPFGVAFGVAYARDARWLFVADAEYQPWTDFESSIALPGYTPGSTNGLRNRVRLSGGVELLPAGNNIFAGYASRVAYRIGVFYDQEYIQPDGITNVNSVGFTGGMSVPLGVPGTRLDIISEIGRRGTTGNGLVRDSFFKFGLNLNIGERWFVKRKLG